MTTTKMPINQIRALYDSEWVLLGDLETTEAFQVLAGTVLFHSKDENEVYQKAVELRPGRFAVRYMGDIPEDAEFLL